jgi:hypothetical protein
MLVVGIISEKVPLLLNREFGDTTKMVNTLSIPPYTTHLHNASPRPQPPRSQAPTGEYIQILTKNRGARAESLGRTNILLRSISRYNPPPTRSTTNPNRIKSIRLDRISNHFTIRIPF